MRIHFLIALMMCSTSCAHKSQKANLEYYIPDNKISECVRNLRGKDINKGWKFDAQQVCIQTRITKEGK